MLFGKRCPRCDFSIPKVGMPLTSGRYCSKCGEPSSKACTSCMGKGWTNVLFGETYCSTCSTQLQEKCAACNGEGEISHVCLKF